VSFLQHLQGVGDASTPRPFQMPIDLVAQLAGEAPGAVVPAAMVGRGRWRPHRCHCRRLRPFPDAEACWAWADPGGLQAATRATGFSRRRHNAATHMSLAAFEFLIAEGFIGQIHRSSRNSAIAERLAPIFWIKASRAR